MTGNRNNTKQEDLLLFGVLLLPVIWFALLLVMFFAMNLHWFNVTGAEHFRDYVLPCISIALAVFILGGLVFLHIRASKRK